MVRTCQTIEEIEPTAATASVRDWRSACQQLRIIARSTRQSTRGRLGGTEAEQRHVGRQVAGVDAVIVLGTIFDQHKLCLRRNLTIAKVHELPKMAMRMAVVCAA